LTSDSVFMLYFVAVIALVVEKTNRYYWQFPDTSDDGPSPARDIIECEMFLFLAFIVQMGQCKRLLDCDWTHHFISKTMTRDRFLHILQYSETPFKKPS
jgi:hypothetical protein